MRRPVTSALLLALLATVFLLPSTAAAAGAMSLRATCPVNLRAQAKTTAPIRRVLKAGVTVKADRIVEGAAWKGRCGSATIAGHRWYRIIAIGGTSVSKLYGVPYLYGVKQAFTTTGTTPWFGRPNPWAGKPFGSFPNAPAGPMWISGDQHGRTISRLTFRNRPAGQNVLVLDKVSNLKIDLIDFDTVPEGIYIFGSHDVEIGRIRARNIFGPFTRTGFHSGNLIQATNSKRLHIHDLKLDQPDSLPAGYGSAYGTEDIITIGGAPGTWGGDSWSAPFLIERFAIHGGAWQSHSGSGIFIGDGGGGQYVWVRDGKLLNPGQVGISIGEDGPYRFQRVLIKATRGNEGIQLRTGRAEFGGLRVDWAGDRAISRNGHTYTTIAPNDWNAVLSFRIAL